MLRTKLIFLFSLFLLLSNNIFAQPNEQRGVQILGTEIYSQARLRKALRLNRYKRFSKGRVRSLRKRLLNYYRRRGYRHARVYIAKYNRRFVAFYIDEGKLARIVFHNVNALDILRMRRDFDLPAKVYHRSKIRSLLRKLKKNYKLRRIYSRLQKSKDFDKANFQLNRDIDFLQSEDSPLAKFDIPSARYELNIFVKKKPKKKSGWVFGARLDFRYGLIPWVQYLKPNLIVKKDKLETELAIGIFYGLNLKFSEAPKFKYARLKADYHYRPIFKKSITPVLKTFIQRTLEDREDVGLDEYVDLRARATLGPGWQIFQGINFFAAYGYEAISLTGATLTEEADINANPLNRFLLSNQSFNSSVDTGWQIIELSLRFEFKPKSLKHDTQQEINLGYNYFFSSGAFNKVFLLANIDYEFENFDLYYLAFEYNWLFDSSLSSNSTLIPFYYEERIAGKNFRGFIGRDFHSRHIGKIANNYRTSLYRDFFYGGIFFDATLFEGSTYDLSGLELGIVGGLSAHFLILDQFNFNIYFGRDLLLTDTKLSQFNLFLSALLKF